LPPAGGRWPSVPRLVNTAYSLAGGSHGASGEALQGVAGTAVAGGEVFPSLVARGVAVVEERRLEAFEAALALLCETVAVAAGRERSWLSRVRAGVVALLGFFDDEPERGRLLIAADRPDDSSGFVCERRVLGVLSGLLDDGVPQALGELTSNPQLTTELIAGGLFSVVRTCVLEAEEGRTRPLVELAPELMAFIVGPYLGQAAARVELEGRPAPLEERGPSGRRLYLTRRTRLVLRAIASAPRSSNREVAQAAGLVDEGQASKLLRRLAERGLIENVGSGQHSGRSNAWLLTSRGEWMLTRFSELANEGRAA
jgi:DNA-binding MarR family transcriptional regulator